MVRFALSLMVRLGKRLRRTVDERNFEFPVETPKRKEKEMPNLMIQERPTRETKIPSRFKDFVTNFRSNEPENRNNNITPDNEGEMETNSSKIEKPTTTNVPETLEEDESEDISNESENHPTGSHPTEEIPDSPPRQTKEIEKSSYGLPRERKNLEIPDTTNFKPMEGRRTRTKVLTIQVPDTPKFKSDFSNAKQEELAQFIEKEVFQEIDAKLVPAKAKVLGSRWVLTEKRSEGNLRQKARIVVQGCHQIKGIDYDESYSPVMSISSLRTILATATAREWKIHQMDVKTAYLNAPLTGEVYVRPPPDIRKENHVWKIKKAMYGLPQAGRDWYKTFSGFLKEKGFDQIDADSCVYQKPGIIIGFYVDYLVITSESIELIAETKAMLTSKFKMKDLGEISTILGIQVEREKSGIKLHQSIYIEETASRFPIPLSESTNSPLQPSVDLTDPSINSTNLDEDLKLLYQKMVGSLMYLAIITRPDIAYAATLLSRFNSAPQQRHMKAVKKVWNYLKNTKDMGIRYFYENYAGKAP